MNKAGTNPQPEAKPEADKPELSADANAVKSAIEKAVSEAAETDDAKTAGSVEPPSDSTASADTTVHSGLETLEALLHDSNPIWSADGQAAYAEQLKDQAAAAKTPGAPTETSASETPEGADPHASDEVVDVPADPIPAEEPNSAPAEESKPAHVEPAPAVIKDESFADDGLDIPNVGKTQDESDDDEESEKDDDAEIPRPMPAYEKQKKKGVNPLLIVLCRPIRQ